MPDTAQLDMGGGGGGGGKGVPGWVMIVGAVAGVAGLALLVKGSGGSGTTAAGTSINAALGSIQEENMNLLGTTQAGFMQTSQQFGTTWGLLSSGFGGVNQAIAADAAQNQANFTALTGQISHLSQDSQNQYSSLLSNIQSGQISQTEFNTHMTGLMNSIQQDVQTGLINQNQANQTLTDMNTGLMGIYSRVLMPTIADFEAQPLSVQQAYTATRGGSKELGAIGWAADAGNAFSQFYAQNPQYAPSAWYALFSSPLSSAQVGTH